MDVLTSEQAQLSPEKQLKLMARLVGVPQRLTIELTTSCQLSCQHCYNFDRQSTDPSTSLALDTVLRILREAAELGVLRLELTGGESTMHPKLQEIVAYAKSLHFWILVKTHGAIGPKKLDSLSECGVDELSISIYGNEEVHDSFTGVRGSWRKSYQTVKAAVDLGLKVSVSQVLHARNHHEIFRQQEEFIKLGANSQLGQNIHPRHDGNEVDASLLLTRQNWVEFYRILYGGKPTGRREIPTERERNFRCACAVDSFAVASNGDVYPCIGVPWKAGSIYEGTLEDIWRNSDVFSKIRSFEAQDFQTCQGCSLKSYCERIAPSAYMTSGDYTGHDPQQCVQAQGHYDYDSEALMTLKSRQGGSS